MKIGDKVKSERRGIKNAEVTGLQYRVNSDTEIAGVRLAWTVGQTACLRVLPPIDLTVVETK